MTRLYIELLEEKRSLPVQLPFFSCFHGGRSGGGLISLVDRRDRYGGSERPTGQQRMVARGHEVDDHLNQVGDI